MFRNSALALLLCIASSCGSAVQGPSNALGPRSQFPTAVDTAAVLRRVGKWWHSLTVADTAYLNRYSAPGLVLTLSNGRTLDRTTMLNEAASHVARWPDAPLEAALQPPHDIPLRLEPIGPGLFEARIPNTSDLAMRFLFAQESKGTVVSLSRLLNNLVVTWPRVP